jgi:siroheme synthase (precorrin-2 oxidase/ferrochelatase)
MTPEQEVTRGHQARRILDDAMYKEAFDTLRDRLVSLLETAELPKSKRERVNNLLIQHSKVRKYMETIMQTGQMAAQQIEKDKTFTERMREKVRSIA